MRFPLRVMFSIAALSFAPWTLLAAQSGKFQLRLHPTPGEVVKYKDVFQTWLSVGSSVAREPAIEIQIWRSETANVHGDTVILVSVVDSARARGPAGALPQEVDQTARMMRGARETTALTVSGRELWHSVRGLGVSDVFEALSGTEAPREEGYRGWQSLPEDSVREGGEWSDTVNIRVDSVEWRGKIDYRLRRVEHRSGHALGRVLSSGTLRPRGGGDSAAPLHVSSEVVLDADTGRLIEATIRQEGGLASRYISVDLRSEWRIQRQ